jgi:hypothetical protein
MLVDKFGDVVCWVLASVQQARRDFIVHWCRMQLQACGRITCRAAVQGCSPLHITTSCFLSPAHLQVANFDMVVEEEAPPEQQQQQQDGDTAAAAGSGGSAEGDAGLAYDPAATELHKSQQAFWAAILGVREPEEGAAAGAAAAAELGLDGGVGRRRARNAARYIFFDSESDTDSGSEEGGDEGDDEGGEGGQQGPGDAVGVGGKRRRGRPRKKRPEDDDVEYEAAVDEQEVRRHMLWLRCGCNS